MVMVSEIMALPDSYTGTPMHNRFGREGFDLRDMLDKEADRRILVIPPHVYEVMIAPYLDQQENLVAQIEAHTQGEVALLKAQRPDKLVAAGLQHDGSSSVYMLPSAEIKPLDRYSRNFTGEGRGAVFMDFLRELYQNQPELADNLSFRMGIDFDPENPAYILLS